MKHEFNKLLDFFQVKQYTYVGTGSNQYRSAVNTQSLTKIMDIAFVATFKAAYFGTFHNPLTTPH